MGRPFKPPDELRGEKAKVMVRMPRKLHQQLVEYCRMHGCSITGLMKGLIEDKLGVKSTFELTDATLQIGDGESIKILDCNLRP